jgi:Uma2 family endonuclease
MTTQAKVWTEAELMALPNDGHKYELVNGELVMSPAGTYGHGDIIAWLSAKLTIFIREHKLGVVFDGQSGFWMKSGNLRSPDISFLCSERVRSLNPKPKGFLQGAPDLAIEVLSPSDTVKDVTEKLADYFESGAKLVWVVNPDNKTLLVYHGTTPDRLLKSGDSIDGETIVPGFQMPVDELFAKPDLD